MGATVTVRIEPQLKQRLEALAKATERSKSFLANQAIREFVELNEWQIEETQKAIKEADQQDFASETDVDALMKKWQVNAD